MFNKIIKYLIGFTIICMIQLACSWLVKISHINFPIPIFGIIVLFILLQTQLIKREWIKDICDLMLKYMPLLFVPLAVGVVAYYGIIEKNLLPILINVIGTTLATLIVTGLFVENVLKYARLRRIRKFRND